MYIGDCAEQRAWWTRRKQGLIGIYGSRRKTPPGFAGVSVETDWIKREVKLMNSGEEVKE